MHKFIFVLFSLSVIIACKEDNKKNKVETSEVSFTKDGELTFYKNSEILTKIDIETAVSDYEQQTGLMYRESMQPHQGMLFIYENERPRPNFYMKNTYIALDLVYINAKNQVVEINKNTTPRSSQPISAQAPAKYVLEVNAGFTDQWNIQVNDSVEFQLEK
ncbi:DUF192 domain-containing protein [Mesonia sp. K7]|uniref:DUF192 domain-containing protein n=1 Tax=Mesonia sp. K7 TaxID=2218606 RepID=UPI000DA991ED|nr:DUF192 domain-containing protein [Mesonia sp. K7]PZD78022.1 DUF192 domain-containing protein [Mesonia sp. K7]